MSKYEIGIQPCDKLQRREGWMQLPNVHQCFWCGGDVTVTFCENCYFDHHENGWNTCKRENEVGKNDSI